MGAIVPHHRPERGDVIKTAVPVGSFDWSVLSELAAFSGGHGGMLIPHCAIGDLVAAAGTGIYHFYVAPKTTAVERWWVVALRAASPYGTTAKVTCGSAPETTVVPTASRTTRTNVFVFREPLAAKSSTPGDVTVTVKATGFGVEVESVACFEQTRPQLDLDTTDWGTDITTLRPRDPIADFANQSDAGVLDAYKNLDARRSGFFAWSTNVSRALVITVGSGTPAALFALDPVLHPAIPAYGDTTCTLTAAVYGKVDAGTGTIEFETAVAGSIGEVKITGTSYGWSTATFAATCEDLTVADGRRGSAWESVGVKAHVTATNTLNIQAIAIVRVTAPI